ncbi:D-alanyl-D-alanine carboxypeptidase family protein [Exiguobacterium aurantiacum]|uniref:M15 family metallopeptidase n=1 Tax=Exiguobacterium aurantiacum TaxID=33987 RepID=UPI00384B3AEE
MKLIRVLLVLMLIFPVISTSAATPSPQPGYTIKTTKLYWRAMQASPVAKTLSTNTPVRYTMYNRSWSNVYIDGTRYYTPSSNLKAGIAKLAPAERIRLVNKQHGLSSTYRSRQLVTLTIPTVYTKGSERTLMAAEAAHALALLYYAGRKEGHTLYALSAYRSYATQKSLYTYWVNTRGTAYASKYVARPGYSEHQTGLAVDMTSARMQMGLYASFDQTPEGKWMLQQAHRYGFIVRYPKGKEKITGYNYEPWHLRYVGVKEATTMKQQNWTFEEWWAER